MTDRNYDVTGDLTPDGTGYFDEAGVHNGEPYYRRHDGAYFIWWNGAFAWYISIALDATVNSWERINPAIAGEYTAQGGHLGIATVSAAT